jgi:hypothetical protein
MLLSDDDSYSLGSSSQESDDDDLASVVHDLPLMTPNIKGEAFLSGYGAAHTHTPGNHHRHRS